MTTTTRTTKKAALTLLASAGFSLAAAAQDLVISNARILDGTGAVVERGTVVVREGRIAAVGANAGTRLRTPCASMPAAAPSCRASSTRIDTSFKATRRAGSPSSRPPTCASTSRPASRRCSRRSTRRSRSSSCAAAPKAARPSGRASSRRHSCRCRAPRSAAVAVDPARTDPARAANRPGATAPGIPPEESLAAVRAAATRGHDAIKTLIIVTRDGPEQATLKLIADEAERLGLLSITHAVSVIDTVAAVEAGTDILVHTPHIGQLDEATAQARSPTPTSRWSRRSACSCPTSTTPTCRCSATASSFRSRRCRAPGQGPVNARLLFQAGITYAYGTDTSWSPRDSLRARAAAAEPRVLERGSDPDHDEQRSDRLGRGDDLGTLEAGKLADIVILGSDPLADEHALLDVDVVIKGGKVVVGGN